MILLEIDLMKSSVLDSYVELYFYLNRVIDFLEYGKGRFDGFFG